ncbi:MAG: dTDP-4-dehydrorhamnose 3,5-epimerase [Endomicrobium sp.]|jgi:dTDP-4-dehydrorhamnose 3,5-epimerase|nr:dTDP-4-dehydrorhamnose 3,5-epimerase [Endomicrobium sp.]
MRITELSIKGAFLIEMEAFIDERGSFARQFCRKELSAYGLGFDIKQCNISNNYKAGVLRGLHYQKQPYPEIKIVSCVKGSCFDVIVDLRKDSPTYLKWVSVELSEYNNKMLYIPHECAHGFQTLEDNTALYYQLSAYHMPDYYAGIRWNDPKIGIKWPECRNRIINERDKNYELL